MYLLQTTSILIILLLLIAWFIHRNDEANLIKKVLEDANSRP